MKKIFAIALALVMVLSMASAFATYCNWGAWDCDSTTIRCGKATIEVVPYVRAATACGFEFASNGCAAAIKGENVYYAVKLVVDADVSEDWWNAATLTIKASDVTNAGNLVDVAVKDALSYATVKDGGTWWLMQTAAGVTDANPLTQGGSAFEKENADFTFGEKNVFSAKATSSKAKICATLKSVWAIGTAKDANYSWDGANSKPVPGAMTIGSYTIRIYGSGANDETKTISVTKGDKIVYIKLDKDSKVDYALVTIDDDDNQYKLNGRNGAGEFTGVVEKTNKTGVTAGTAVALGTTCNEGAYLKEVFDFLKIDFGTCMTDQGISNNFGWNDEIKSCTAYKTQGTAVVDAECVVAIPKTGDASVLAWLF